MRPFICAGLFAMSILLSAAALAQEAGPGVDILPAGSVASEEGDTAPALRLTPDKSELIRIDRDAASIVIGNPSHLSVLAENSRTLVLVPGQPGATYFSVLDENGSIIMQRHVLVAAPKDKYVRIRRSCTSKDKGCQDTQVYYCPDMCHEINIPEAAIGAGNGGAQPKQVVGPADQASPAEAPVEEGQ